MSKRRKGGMPNTRGGGAGGGLVRARWLPAQARLLYQPMVLGIANKAAAAVLLSVNRAG